MGSKQKIAVIGGGAAGFFAAIAAKQHWPEANVCLLEKSNKFLSKVKISGGGRCNVTHDSPDINELSKAYPRGNTQLRKAFHQFAATDTVEWFESRGVALKVYPDGCVFPVANDSQVVIDCFMNTCKQLGITLKTQQYISSIEVSSENVLIHNNEEIQTFDHVIICAGGHPIGLAPSPSGPPLPASTKLKSAALFFGACHGLGGPHITLKLADGDLGSVNGPSPQWHRINPLRQYW
jgi:predicted Rossmann fold flavoprotein